MRPLRLAMVALTLAALAGPASARIFANCSKADRAIADAAVEGAMGLAVTAAAAVGDTPEYRRWFGVHSGGRAETVRKTLKAIHRALAADQLRIDCEGRKDVTCAAAYAYIEPVYSGVVNLCPGFFAMPAMAEAMAGTVTYENGTREGVLIHELSHFPAAGSTGDACWSRTMCRTLARGSPDVVVATADSFEYFAEDVTLAAGPPDGD